MSLDCAVVFRAALFLAVEGELIARLQAQELEHRGVVVADLLGRILGRGQVAQHLEVKVASLVQEGRQVGLLQQRDVELALLVELDEAALVVELVSLV